METIEMSSCCASGRVSFLGGVSSVCPCECVRTCPSAPQRPGVSECVELAWGLRAGERPQSRAHPGAPVVPGVWEPQQ